MSDLLPVPDPAPLPSPRVSISPLSSPTAIGLAIETWLRCATLRRSLSPRGTVFRLRIGTRQASVQMAVESGAPGIAFEIPEPSDPARKAAWIRLLSSIPTFSAAGLTSSGRPIGPVLVRRCGFSPSENKDWALAALRALDIDWVDLHGDLLGWA